ncbi:hypothetical protein [Paenibacillus sp.]|uniref:hypothetical protein n=1 Tax=Paenibacillus sp. TaxID=58172 RepID=UPI002D5F5855|nr:hypothetical protein [Paenibacillus sp.]HZG58293.1 hypothetical protein [Paenibacillus sp.]
MTPMILTFSKSMTSRDLTALLALILGVATLIMPSVMIRFENSNDGNLEDAAKCLGAKAFYTFRKVLLP